MDRNEFANHNWVHYQLSFDNKRTLPRLRTLCCGCVSLVFMILFYFSVLAVYEQAQLAEKLEYRPCDPNLPPPTDLIAEILENQKAYTVSYYCSTQNQRIQQACVCCVKEECWRDVKIVSNATLDPAVIIDRVGYQKYERHVPKSMQVCYKYSNEYSTCEKVEGPKVGIVLRAIEKLNGWSPNGESVQ